MEQRPKLPHQRLIIVFVIGLILAGLLVVFLDWHNMQRVLQRANWVLVLAAVPLTACSYFFMSYGYAIVNDRFGINLGLRDLIEIGFVSTVLNHLLSTGGAAGFSIRYVLMGSRGAGLRDIVAASLFYSYFSSLGMLAMLPVGMFYLFVKHPMSGQATTGVGVAAGALIVVFVLATALVFWRGLRTRVLNAGAKVGKAIIRRDVTTPLHNFDATMAEGIAEIGGRPLTLVLVIVTVAIDWALSVATLWICFEALGEHLRFYVLLTGFSLGVTAGVLSMVPGGFGIQEGSMAGIYALLGVPIQVALLAAILFRIVFYFLPYFASLGFYWRLLREARSAEG